MGDVDMEVALAMNAITESKKNDVTDAEVGCKKQEASQPCMISIMDLYKSLSSKVLQSRKIWIVKKTDNIEILVFSNSSLIDFFIAFSWSSYKFFSDSVSDSIFVTSSRIV